MARDGIDSEDFWMPLDRVRWVRDGESFQAGDRTLVAVRPPLFDNPTTRGLLDTTTRVSWSVDAFGANLPHPVTDAAELDRDTWREGVLLINRLNHPWYRWLDQATFQARVAQVQHLGIEVLASCHGPVVHGAMVDEAFELVRRIPGLPPWQEPGQDDLEAMLAAAAGALTDAGPERGAGA
jgi:flavorubredoxin